MNFRTIPTSLSGCAHLSPKFWLRKQDDLAACLVYCLEWEAQPCKAGSATSKLWVSSLQLQGFIANLRSLQTTKVLTLSWSICAYIYIVVYAHIALWAEIAKTKVLNDPSKMQVEVSNQSALLFNLRLKSLAKSLKSWLVFMEIPSGLW